MAITKQHALEMLFSAEVYLRMSICTSLEQRLSVDMASEILDDLSINMIASAEQMDDSLLVGHANNYADKWLQK